METIKTLKDLYKYPGFRPYAKLESHPLDTNGYVITLHRRQKKVPAPAAGPLSLDIETVEHTQCVTFQQVPPTSIFGLNTGGFTVPGAML